jgi:hypothetical protein
MYSTLPEPPRAARTLMRWAVVAATCLAAAYAGTIA